MGRGYPDHYVGHYPQLARWLLQQGHIVYNYEMQCEPVPVNTGRSYEVAPWYGMGGGLIRPGYTVQCRRWLYGNVDVTSWHHDLLYAWEYKSAGDKLPTAALQCWNYSRSYDVVCLACVKAPKGETLEQLQFIGAGIYQETEGGFVCLQRPELQQPDHKLHDALVARFRRNALGKTTVTAAAGRQVRLPGLARL